MIYKYTQNYNALTIAGHTHCGQVNLPIIKDLVSPTDHKFIQNYQEINGNKLFITCCAVETLIPIRFFTYPRIDILYL